MTTKELALAILDFLKDPGTNTGRADIQGYAHSIGVSNRHEIDNAVKVLERRGLVKIFGSSISSITGWVTGTFDGILDPPRSSAGPGIHIGSISHSNIMTDSPGSSQTLKLGADVASIIDGMRAVIRDAREIDPDDRSDLAADVNALQTQLGKKTKSRPIIESLLENLTKVAPLVPYVAQVVEYLRRIGT
jgi:hypothetical protein